MPNYSLWQCENGEMSEIPTHKINQSGVTAISTIVFIEEEIPLRPLPKYHDMDGIIT